MISFVVPWVFIGHQLSNPNVLMPCASLWPHTNNPQAGVFQQYLPVIYMNIAISVYVCVCLSVGVCGRVFFTIYVSSVSEPKILFLFVRDSMSYMIFINIIIRQSASQVSTSTSGDTCGEVCVWMCVVAPPGQRLMSASERGLSFSDT